jgi:phthalate 4,5-cis-dihydrodiol dehydrogenase
MTRVTIALAGVGRAGARHLAASSQVDAIDLVCVVDRNPAVSKQLAPGIATFHTIDQALESLPISALVVATPSETHADMAIAAMHRGLDVLVEKPMALTVSDCDRMLEAQASTNTLLMVGHTFHFDRVMQQAREIVREGKLGRPIWLYEQFVRPRPPSQPAWMDAPDSGGLLMSNGVHLIDRTMWLLGEPVVSVNSEVRRPIVGEDSAQGGELACVTMTFKSGAVATLVLAEPRGGPSSRVAELILTSGRVRYTDELEIGQGDVWTRIAVDTRDPFELQLEEFAMAIGTRQADPDGWWGRSVVQVATLAERRPWSPANHVQAW